MSERQLSLIDVQVGMYQLSLQTRLTPPCFRFFWGLIMMANTLKPRFKNPFDLTVDQAMGIGGGKSRQTIWDKQKRLRKIRINGEWLIKIRSGNRLNNESASYKINYDLIVPESLFVPEFTAQSSNIIDDQRTNPLTINGRSADHPKIREEEEEIKQATSNEVSTSNGEPQNENEEAGVAELDSDEEELRMIQKATELQDLIFRKWRDQIEKGPDIASCKKALREFDWDHKLLVQAVNEAPATLNVPTSISALNLVWVIARRIDNERNSGISPQLLADRQQEIDDLKVKLLEARKKPEENEAFISQNEYVLALKEESLDNLKQA